jgi:hypothetical protein
MPPVDLLAKEVVDQHFKEWSSAIREVKTNARGESIDPGLNVPGFDAEIVPLSSKAARINVHAPADAWDVSIAFGECSHTEIPYVNDPDGARTFQRQLSELITAVMSSRWEEHLVLFRNRIVCCSAIFPRPAAQYRSTMGIPGIISRYFPLPGQSKKTIHWEPYK